MDNKKNIVLSIRLDREKTQIYNRWLKSQSDINIDSKNKKLAEALIKGINYELINEDVEILFAKNIFHQYFKVYSKDLDEYITLLAKFAIVNEKKINFIINQLADKDFIKIEDLMDPDDEQICDPMFVNNIKEKLDTEFLTSKHVKKKYS